MSDVTTPTAIHLKKTEALLITWADGRESHFSLRILRKNCPCAGCQGHSGTIKLVEATDAQQELEDITTVGGYALALKWFDGHDSGIYSYKYLRSICHCPECLAAASDQRDPGA